MTMLASACCCACMRDLMEELKCEGRLYCRCNTGRGPAHNTSCFPAPRSFPVQLVDTILTTAAISATPIRTLCSAHKLFKQRILDVDSLQSRFAFFSSLGT